MNELVKTIDELYAAFKTDAELQADAALVPKSEAKRS